tara:strand:+ start:8185 stop:8928 length:744 start_codon:yes stop_codon:yes gene_type:complete
MTIGKKLLWGSMGWVLGGPIGAIVGYAIASMDERNTRQGWGQTDAFQHQNYPRTKPGDFIVSLLVLFAKVMKADNKLLKSELDYVKQFLRQQFTIRQTQEFMVLLKDILQQEYALKDVCRQIQRSMDHPSRLEIIHILFGLSASDGEVHPEEVRVIHTIANYLNINQSDYKSIKAMFIGDSSSAYTILEIDSTVSDQDVKKAYRKMANKYHPDKVSHLGKDLQKVAEEKFKSVNNSYQTIKKERGLK